MGPILGTGSNHYAGRYAKKPVAGRGAGAANTVCQKCLQVGHWTYECKNAAAYAARPTRTKQLTDPKYRPRFLRAGELLPENRPQEQAAAGKDSKKKNKKRAEARDSSSDDSSSGGGSSSSDSDSSDDSSDSSDSSGSSSSGSDSSGSDSSSSGSSSSNSGSSDSSDSSEDSSSSDDSRSASPPPKQKRERRKEEPEKAGRSAATDREAGASKDARGAAVEAEGHVSTRDERNGGSSRGRELEGTEGAARNGIAKRKDGVLSRHDMDGSAATAPKEQPAAPKRKKLRSVVVAAED